MSIGDQIRTRPKLWASAALVSAGLASGTLVGALMTGPSGAATTSSTAASTPSSSNPSSSNPSSSSPSGSTPTGSGPSSGSGTTAPRSGMPGGACVLPDSGTVSAVGTDSVTIDGTTYAVTSSSDIDKNGEAGLSALAVGDKVTFSTVSSAATPTIDKLHAGNEALDHPTGLPGGPRGTAPAAGTGTSGA